MQSVSYLPHFLSIVIVAGMVMQLTVRRRHGQPDRRGGRRRARSRSCSEPEWFRTIYVSSEVWQTVGWGTILYLAALTTIDEHLYEAARIDGANRWRQTWHVTLPGIRPTMMTLLILNIGTFMAVGFEKILLLYNPLTYPTADVISTYLYRVGHRVQQLQLRRGHRPVRGDHRADPGPVGERDLPAHGGGEPVVTIDLRHGRRRDRAPASRTPAATGCSRWSTPSILIVVVVVTLYPFVNIVARSFSAEALHHRRPGQPGPARVQPRPRTSW